VNSTGGSFSAAAGATLELIAGTSVYAGTYGSSIGSGTGEIRLGTGTMEAGAGGVPFNFPPDSPLL
jgi:hypothetical protein